MFTIAFVLFLLPQVISAQCNDLGLDWGTYSGTYNKETGVSRTAFGRILLQY